MSLSPAHGPYTVAGYPKVVECDYPTLAVGQVVVDTITGTVDASLLPGSSVINQVVVFAQTFDPDLSNNLAISVGPASTTATTTSTTTSTATRSSLSPSPAPPPSPTSGSRSYCY